MGQRYEHRCNVPSRGDDCGIPSRGNATRDVKPQHDDNNHHVGDTHKDTEVWW